ncbi:unnamed protein product, partial [Discosporangium mesarthrocarpum]
REGETGQAEEEEPPGGGQERAAGQGLPGRKTDAGKNIEWRKTCGEKFGGMCPGLSLQNAGKTTGTGISVWGMPKEGLVKGTPNGKPQVAKCQKTLLLTKFRCHKGLTVGSFIPKRTGAVLVFY